MRGYLEELAPSYLEADWDNSGSQVDPNQEKIEKVLIGLDPTLDFILQGRGTGADLLLTHHPLIFSRLDKIDRNTLTGKKIFSLIENGLGLISIHTPMDQSSRGISQGLAERLKLKSTRPLKSITGANLFKLEVFVPEGQEEKVTEALLEAGAGEIGDYSDSYYRSRAEGNFKPGESADPYAGRQNETTSTKEVKLEFLLKRKFQDRVISTLNRVHPYEQPGFSLVKTERKEDGVGLGRLGKWDGERNMNKIQSLIEKSLNVSPDEITLSGNPTEPVEWVGTSPGAGGEAVKPTLQSGAKLLITGELDYHERGDAVENGLAVIEVGHYHSEKVFIEWTRDLLRENFTSSELTIELYEEEDKS
ncbi:Nif3-like dinuclear metal center hexameric protein [Candidatus Bipolaricaulota bacterium]|nr:Nif3-like dinuclear metal center hexameric protein [Candidatus Bipolaricaulota bacterium]